MERKRIAEATKGVGKPKVGGPFELIDQHRNPFSSEDMKGKYALVSYSMAYSSASILKADGYDGWERMCG